MESCQAFFIEINNVGKLTSKIHIVSNKNNIKSSFSAQNVNTIGETVTFVIFLGFNEEDHMRQRKLSSPFESFIIQKKVVIIAKMCTK